MIELNILETLLSGGGLVAILGWVYTSLKSASDNKALRLKVVEERLTELDKVDLEYKESVKRVHDRIKFLEASHTKLETKLDTDIQAVKHSIDHLTDLVIKALQRGDSRS